ncbi:hypothetical protein [Aquaspirillum serpens]|uniref:hypothetical protein n=1 Tax=Aquaspirillum serpens TaxID=190 RepID=UPI00040F86B2|nr:hypothetical protein [Aquaspirillum serpens]
MRKHSFVFLHKPDSNTNLATLHTATRLLWNTDTSNHYYSTTEGRKIVAEGQWAGLKGWQLPNVEQLKTFVTKKQNPHKMDETHRFLSINNQSIYWLLTNEGACKVHNLDFTINQSNGIIFSTHSLWATRSDAEILLDLIDRSWQLMAPNGETFTPNRPDTRLQGLSDEKLLATWLAEGVTLQEAEGKGLTLNPSKFFNLWQLFRNKLSEDLTPSPTIVNPNSETSPNISNKLEKNENHPLTLLDYIPCRLPKIDIGQICDPNKGLWELWDAKEKKWQDINPIARDPLQDVQRRAIAIDFGTSSTVVAMDTRSGQRELLRIGVRDFYQPVKASDFENPTVLECIDFASFSAAWTEKAYRPALNWDWMRAAHEAQANFRDNEGDTEILASILPRLKQWALRSEQHRIRMTDRKGHEIELPPHSERNPVRGQPLKASKNDAFDPIELYAWYLGMAINHRERGLFLKYYLSFPVKYPKEVKERILASFRRGLQRSLPQTLIDNHPQVLNEFEVNDLASEPAAYAAAALAHFDVKPTDEGVPYAVFDFGGGTTDFDFGFLRWANDDEDDQGYEQVFEHLASGGDNFLGGENLLEHLVYHTFCQNLDELRKHRIQFTQPLDAQPFSGSEAFLAKTQAAQTNTVMLAAKLRPFLEANTEDARSLLESQIKMDLIKTDGEKIRCDIAINAEALETLLQQRIFRGGEAFLVELAMVNESFPKDTPIHILLAGNGSRSRHVKAFFEEENLNEALIKVFGDGKPVPKVIVHEPLPMDESKPHAPTAKTGVALGLLRVSPGKNILLKNHVHAQHEGQAPFAWFVGRMRRGQLESKLSPRSSYGTWHEIGRLQDGVFYLSATNSPRAHTGLAEGDPELKVQRIDFPAAPAGGRVFAKAVAPSVLHLAAVLEESDLDKEGLDVRTLNLDAI